MNPNDIFWVARYAHRVISPLAKAQDGYLILHTQFGGAAPGVDIWVHPNDHTKSGLIGHKIMVTTKEQVDQFAKTLQPALATV